MPASMPAVPTAPPVAPIDQKTVPRRLAIIPPPPVPNPSMAPDEPAVTRPVQRRQSVSPDDEATRRSAQPSHDDIEQKDAALGRVLSGKYELVRLLGTGGMGKVFEGYHRSLGVRIAVKTMHPSVAAMPDYVRRFRREAHAASVLNHPSVVRVLDFGEDDGLLYMVMEYIDGASLAEWMRSMTSPPRLADVVEIIAMICDAFESAHAHGIIHRDLKPDNVLLTKFGDKRLVKVVDFGLAHVHDARDTGPTLTSTDIIAGTPEYMSPEQCRSLSVGPSADLYSIGCVLTALLQLRPPFRERSPMDTMAKHMFSPVPPLSRPAGAEPVPPLLERLRLSLLAKKPEQRPKNAAEIKRLLLEAMSPEAAEAKLPERKDDTPLGERSARAPEWDHNELEARAAEERPRTVGLFRLAPKGAGIDEACETALAAQRMRVIELVDVERDLGPQTPSVLVIDAGMDVDGACAKVAAVASRHKETRVVVCAEGLSSARMNALVAAGAADVVRYPVTPDTLAKKVDRVLRRGR